MLVKDFVDIGVSDAELEAFVRQCKDARREIFEAAEILFDLRDFTNIHATDLDEWALMFKKYKDSPMYQNQPAWEIIKDGYINGLNLTLLDVGLAHYLCETDEYFPVNLIFRTNTDKQLTIMNNPLDGREPKPYGVCYKGVVKSAITDSLVGALLKHGIGFERNVVMSYCGDKSDILDNVNNGKYDIPLFKITKAVTSGDYKQELYDVVRTDSFGCPVAFVNDKEKYGQQYERLYSLFLSKSPLAGKSEVYIYDDRPQGKEEREGHLNEL